MINGRGLRIGAGFVGGLLIAASLHAASGGTASSPVKARNRHGLNVTVDSRGIESDGYRPIRVKITPWPPVPATFERSIRLAVAPNHYDTGSVDTEVSQVFELKQGDTAVEGVILAPQDRIFGHILVEVFEDGERLRDMELRINSSRGGWWNQNNSVTAILFVDSDAFTRERQATAVQERTSGRWKGEDTFELPDVRHLAALFPDPYSGQGQLIPNPTEVLPKQPDIATIALVHDHSRFDLVGPAELPEDWLALTGYDALYIDRGDLLLTAEKHPQRLRAMIDWLETGALLVVADGGKEFEHVADLEKLLSLRPAPAFKKDPAKRPAHGWIFPNDKDFDQAAATAAPGQPGMVYRNGRTYYNGGVAEHEPLNLTKEERAKLLNSPPFLYRTAGLGCLAVFREEKPLSGQVVTWRALFASAGNQRMQWQSRHGVSSTGRNPGYWSFLIPGVGMSPVMAFLALISLFMLLIGPVNYWLLRRARRTHWLLITVPAGALVMTAGLFLYALITDGLGVSSRIRSYTWLDDRGRAVSWSRHSYYASLAPGKGLIFPADAAAYPVIAEAWETQHASRQRRMRWENGEQQLRAGYVSPRTVTQFLVLRATDAKQALKWSTPAAASEPPEIVNELGVMIEVLLAKNEQGDLFRGENIAPGAKVKLAPHKATDARAEWLLMYNRNEPKPLHADDAANNQNLFSFIIPGFARGQWMEAQSSDSSLLERRLREARDGNPPPRTWVAQTGRSAAVPIAVDYAVEKAGFHVIGGSW